MTSPENSTEPAAVLSSHGFGAKADCAFISRTIGIPATSRRGIMCILLPVLATTLMLTGCCVSISTSVRNETGRDIRLTLVRQSQQVETVMIRASSTGRCTGVIPALPGLSPDSWIISDGQSQFTFANVSSIATLPGPFISSSRFTRDFPCRRITQHVSLAPDITIHAVRVIGYTESEPAQFPIRYSKREVER